MVPPTTQGLQQRILVEAMGGAMPKESGERVTAAQRQTVEANVRDFAKLWLEQRPCLAERLTHPAKAAEPETARSAPACSADPETQLSNPLRVKLT